MKKIIIIISVCLSMIVECQIAKSQGTWTQREDFQGTARIRSVGFSIGMKGYILTGSDNDSLRSDFWEWDQITNTWTQKASFKGTPRRGAVGFSIGTKGYIGTGVDKDSLRSDFWEWDQTTDRWSKKANFGGSARAYAVGFSIGEKGYIGTGYDNVRIPHGTTMDFWEYDQISDSWTKKSDFGGGRRMYAAGFTVGQRGYILFGGDSNIGSYYKDFWEWDQATDTWLQKSDFPDNYGRVEATSFVIGSQAYVGTGYYLMSTVWTYICNDLYKWDQSTDTWERKADLNTGTYAAVGFSIGDKGYVGTGGYYPARRDFWEYCPSCIENGIPGSSISSDIIIFPNPFSFQTMLLSNKVLKDATLKLYNSLGQEMSQINKICKQNITIYRNNLSSGVYFLQLIQDNQTIATKKVIITDN